MSRNYNSTDQTEYFSLITSAGDAATSQSVTGFTIGYIRDRGIAVTSAGVQLAGANSTHTDWGVFEFTTPEGYYRVDFPDAAYASGSSKVQLFVSGSGIRTAELEIDLKYDIESFFATVTPTGVNGSYNDKIYNIASVAEIATGIDDNSADINTLVLGVADLQARVPAALVGGRIDANVGAISTDSTAADNMESVFDGTGYAGTGNVIPTVTTLTNAPLDSAGITTLLTRITAAVALNSDMATLLSRIVGTIAAETDNAQSGDAYAIVNNGTYGNSAIETLVDELETRLTVARAGYLDNIATAPPAANDIVTALWASNNGKIIETINRGTYTQSTVGSTTTTSIVYGGVTITITQPTEGADGTRSFSVVGL